MSQWPEIALPEPRRDGKCCVCTSNDVVTKDGRFCKVCLKSFVARCSPGGTRPRGMYRTEEQRAGYDREPSPMGENCVRAMEGD